MQVHPKYIPSTSKVPIVNPSHSTIDIKGETYWLHRTVYLHPYRTIISILILLLLMRNKEIVFGVGSQPTRATQNNVRVSNKFKLR